MKMSKFLVTKLFCIIASIMCVNKAGASDLVNTENLGASLNISNQLANTAESYDVAWSLCCGFGSDDDSSSAANSADNSSDSDRVS